jgi:pyruvate/2-oxoglutarate dehydrogenase complex dihydrolipoamide dehydrogenase (E3) component
MTSLLVATRLTPASDRLNIATAGIEVDTHGHVRTDDTYATNEPDGRHDSCGANKILTLPA